MNDFYCFFKIWNWFRVGFSQFQDALKWKHTLWNILNQDGLKISKLQSDADLQQKFNTSNPLEGKDKEGLEILSLTNRVTLELLEWKHKVSVLLPWKIRWVNRFDLQMMRVFKTEQTLTAACWPGPSDTWCLSHRAHRGRETRNYAGAQCLQPERPTRSLPVAAPDPWGTYETRAQY